MTREEMTQRVNMELAHIPRNRADYENEPAQRELRMVFNMLRRHMLARDPDTAPGITLSAAIESVRQRHPTFAAVYDAAYFDAK
jgi:hypothetical protein